MKKEKKKSKKSPKGKTVKRELPFKLTDTEKAERALEAAHLDAEIADFSVQKKLVSDEWSAKIRSRTSKRTDLLKQINDGIEHRDVECTEVKNFDTNKVEYWLDGSKISERDLTETDRQLDLDEASARKGKKKADEAKAAAVANPKTAEQLEQEKAKACVATPAKKPSRGQRQELPSDRDLDIAATHREETSKRGSYSTLNGVR